MLDFASGVSAKARTWSPRRARSLRPGVTRGPKLHFLHLSAGLVSVGCIWGGQRGVVLRGFCQQFGCRGAGVLVDNWAWFLAKPDCKRDIVTVVIVTTTREKSIFVSGTLTLQKALLASVCVSDQPVVATGRFLPLQDQLDFSVDSVLLERGCSGELK